jgi:hypothetical protein
LFGLDPQRSPIVKGAVYLRIVAVLAADIARTSSLLLAYVLDTGVSRLVLLTGLLAPLGAGQGLFTAPNDSEVMGGATGKTGQAGGLLQMFRTFGISLGISLASIILSLQLHEARGRPSMIKLPAADVTRGAAMSFIAFAALALVATLLSLVWADAD